jgi:hypothetical protein
VLAGLQLRGRGHEVEHVVEGGGHLVEALGQPGGAEALAKASELLVGQHDLQDAERVDQLHDVGNENHPPTNRDSRRIELDLEFQGHADGSWEHRQGAEVLAVREVVLPAARGGNDVEAQDEGHEDGDNESATIGDPESPQLDVDVAQTVEAERLEVVDEAQENADTGIDVVLVEILLAIRIQAEVLGSGILREL